MARYKTYPSGRFSRQEKRNLQRKLHDALNKSLRDSLTDCYDDRKFMLESLTRMSQDAKARGECFVIYFIDIDNFKKFNDLHTHVVGDHVLQETAISIKSCMRIADILFRYGGDEFVLGVVIRVKPGDDSLKHITQLAQNIADRVSQSAIISEGEALSVSVTIGWQIIDLSISIEDAIKKASRKMKLHKQPK